ncbi:RNA-guided endonuclease InsQ/TnpB family protein [Natrarchaeobius chitinivorans]|uniref:Transposase n=1 Tax=Natrarchaeobius chitinivorans TaxID=1679083 RepID=A0A3N6LZ78_NATCH|nr:RNA-guided endonuclease TnpB family protein [Natrarchaeobius chitinivorans]RQG94467.1 transposase [Natrarchaeobius chitinivorans]
MGDDGYLRRTAITRVTVSQSDEKLLRRTVDEWLEACNIASEMAWNGCDSAVDVQNLAYDRIRDETALGSQHAILATHHVARAVKSGLERRRNGKTATRPDFTSRSMTFDTRSMTVFEDRGEVSLTTLGDHDRVRATLLLPDDSGYQHQFLECDEWEPTESTLHYRDGNWYLHLGFRKPNSEDPKTENGTVLGVDLGVAEIAVTSTARFFSAGELNHARREFERVRADLQARGTRSAYRTLEKVSGRETEVVKHVLHDVANGIVEEALEYDCAGIVFEELTGIRDRLPEANWHSEWAFDTLLEYVTYKAKAEGLFVDTTMPKDTSRRCPECEYIDDENRLVRNQFECQSCGCTGHADYIASKNVAARYLRRDQQLSRRRGVSQYALKSGTMTPTGEYSPYSPASSDESTGKSTP